MFTLGRAARALRHLTKINAQAHTGIRGNALVGGNFEHDLWFQCCGAMQLGMR